MDQALTWLASASRRRYTEVVKLSRRILLNIATGVSLLIFLATGAFYARSYRVQDHVSYFVFQPHSMRDPTGFRASYDLAFELGNGVAVIELHNGIQVDDGVISERNHRRSHWAYTR